MPDEVGMAGGACLLAGVVWMIVGAVLSPGGRTSYITPTWLLASAPLGFLLWLLGCVLLVIYALGGGEYR